MATITYTRTKHQPEVLYLPLEHGGFIQLQEGTHDYAEHAGQGLINSTNTTVRNYIKTGMLTVRLSGEIQIPVVDAQVGRKFAELDKSDNFGIGNKSTYAPINNMGEQSDNESVTTREPEENSDSETLVSTDVNSKVKTKGKK